MPETIPTAQVEEIARQVFWEQIETLRQDLLEEARAQVQRSAEAQANRVWEAIHALTEAQTRTEKRVEELAQAQARTEERLTRLEAAVERLAEAQARTEERLTRLEAAVERLAEAQARTEERLTRLEDVVEHLAEAQTRTEEAVARLSRHVEHLSNLMGADLEVDAEELLVYVLKQKGYRPLGPAHPIAVDGEVDVAVPVENPQGERLWALVEAKARVREKELRQWARRLKEADFLQRLAEARIERPYLPYIFGLRIYPQVIEVAQDMGIGVLDSRGERVVASPMH